MRKFFHVAFVSALLTGMLLSLLPIELLHEHHSHHDTISHTAEDEADPCHVSIYHPEKKDLQTCVHHEHLRKKDDVCELCKVVFPVLKKEVAVAVKMHSLSAPVIKSSALQAPDLTGDFPGCYNGRAPPAII
jgi:hypothetical protein